MWFRVKGKDILVEAKYIAIGPTIFGKGKVNITSNVSGDGFPIILSSYEVWKKLKEFLKIYKIV